MNSNPLLLRSSTDPLAQNTEAARDLFHIFSVAASNGSYTTVDVMNAACVALNNALRQHCAERAAAERTFDEIVARAKAQLMDCYDGAGRRKAGIFPFDQHIEMPGMLDKDGFFRR
jgi:hypothetical protein